MSRSRLAAATAGASHTLMPQEGQSTKAWTGQQQRQEQVPRQFFTAGTAADMGDTPRSTAAQEQDPGTPSSLVSMMVHASMSSAGTSGLSGPGGPGGPGSSDPIAGLRNRGPGGLRNPGSGLRNHGPGGPDDRAAQQSLWVPAGGQMLRLSDDEPPPRETQAMHQELRAASRSNALSAAAGGTPTAGRCAAQLSPSHALPSSSHERGMSPRASSPGGDAQDCGHHGSPYGYQQQQDACHLNREDSDAMTAEQQEVHHTGWTDDEQQQVGNLRTQFDPASPRRAKQQQQRDGGDNG